jgi:hypothetical protein
LLENFCGNYCLVVGDDSAGVDQGKAFSIPIRFTVNAIARDARLVADNRAPLADQAIEQRRLADVRPADNRDERQRYASRLQLGSRRH